MKLGLCVVVTKEGGNLDRQRYQCAIKNVKYAESTAYSVKCNASKDVFHIEPVHYLPTPIPADSIDTTNHIRVSGLPQDQARM